MQGCCAVPSFVPADLQTRLSAGMSMKLTKLSACLPTAWHHSLRVWCCSPATMTRQEPVLTCSSSRSTASSFSALLATMSRALLIIHCWLQPPSIFSAACSTQQHASQFRSALLECVLSFKLCELEACCLDVYTTLPHPASLHLSPTAQIGISVCLAMATRSQLLLQTVQVLNMKIGMLTCINYGHYPGAQRFSNA